MKAEQEKLEAKKYCKDCRWYSKPKCTKVVSETGHVIYTARKSTCPVWARRS